MIIYPSKKKIYQQNIVAKKWMESNKFSFKDSILKYVIRDTRTSIKI